MPWYPVGALAGALAPLVIWFSDFRMMLREGGVVIRIGPLPDSDLVARRLMRMALWTCARPGYLAEHGTPAAVADLGNHTLLAAFDRPMTWSFEVPGGEWQRIEVQPGSVVPEPTVMRCVLVDGACIGRLPDFLAAEAIAGGELVRLFPDARSDAVDVNALYPSHRSLSAKVRVFIDALAESLSKRGLNDPSA